MFAVLRGSVRNDARDHDRGDHAQSGADLSSFVEPPHMRITRSEKPIDHRPTRSLLYRRSRIAAASSNRRLKKWAAPKLVPLPMRSRGLSRDDALKCSIARSG